MKQVHLIISGHVQGVGYRAWLAHNAKQLMLTGWVYNRPDRTVEAVCEGSDEQLQKIIQLVWKGPWTAEVSEVSVNWKSASTTFKDFKIKAHL